MSRTFLSLANSNDTPRITLSMVAKNDIIPWFMSAGLASLLFIGVSLLISSAQPDMNNADATANLYALAQPFYFALIVLACLLSRRSKDLRTWILIGVVIVFFVPQFAVNFAISILPNSILQAMVAMIGLLAGERIIEYIHIRYIIKLDQLTFSTPALVSYGVLIAGAIFLLSPFIYEFFNQA